MTRPTSLSIFRLVFAIGLCIASLCTQARTTAAEGPISAKMNLTSQLSKSLNVGDVVFIHVSPYPFEQVSLATQSWVNHVGIVTDVSGSEPVIAESTFPFSRTTTLTKFVKRSKHGQIAVARLNVPLTGQQVLDIRRASNKRMGIFYDTGFNLNSRREFCSRFVQEVLAEATGVTVGKIETFKSLLRSNPQTDLTFWHVWYFGSIPWERKTVTPASLYRSDHMNIVFEGFVG